MSRQIINLTKQTLTYGLGNILTRFITFLLLPLFTNLLTPEEYGLATLVFVFLGFMNIIYHYGIDSAFLRSFGEAKDKDSKRRLFSTAIWLSLGTGFTFSLLIYTFSGSISAILLKDTQYVNIFRLAAGVLLFDSAAHVPFALLRMKEKAITFIIIKLINVVTTLGLNIYFIAVVKTGISGIFLSAFIASVITVIIVYSVTISSLRFNFSLILVKDYLKFGLPFVPAGLASIMMETIDRYIIEHLKGTATVGLYSAGYKLGIFMLLITTAFNYAWQPFFLRIGNTKEAKPVFARVFTYYILGTLFVWITLSAFIHEIVRFKLFGFSIIGPSFYDSEIIIPVVLLAYIFQGVYLNFMPGIYFEKKTHYILLFTFSGALVNICLNFVLIPRFGIMGSAVATLAGYVTMALITFPVTQKLFKVPYEWSQIFKIVLSSIIAIYTIIHFGNSLSYKFLSVLIFLILILFMNFPLVKTKVKYLFK